MFCRPLLLSGFSTVYTGFCDQSPSKGSRSLNPQVAFNLSGFLRKKRHILMSLFPQSLLYSDGGPTTKLWSLNPEWPLNPM